MPNGVEDGQDVVEVVRGDRQLRDLVRDLRADPPGQARLFRGVRLLSGDPCVLKTDLGELEALWMPAVSSLADDVVARVLAEGVLTGSGRHWLLLEDLPHRARSDRPPDTEGVMRAAARFQQVAEHVELPTYPIDAEFFSSYGRESVAAGCPGPCARVLARVDGDERWLRSLGGHVCGHGDVHFWNAVAATPDGPWRLIDPIPRTAHWAWDAAYAQLTSGVADTRPHRPAGRRAATDRAAGTWCRAPRRRPDRPARPLLHPVVGPPAGPASRPLVATTGRAPCHRTGGAETTDGGGVTASPDGS